MSTKKDKHPDIILIEERLKVTIKQEEYENAAVLKRWLESLEKHHGKKQVKKDNKRRNS